MDAEFDKVDVRNWLPYGDQLRVLLSSDHISLGEIASLAKSKGLFSSALDRGQLIQFLSTTLIRPVEFETLLESAVSRESKPKEQPQEVPLTSPNANWQEKVRELGNDIASVVKLDKVPGAVFSSEPEISFPSKDHLVVSYEISRQDYSKDLLHRDLTFKGEISIRQDGGSLSLSVISRHTAKETVRINDQILGHIVRNLKSAGLTKEDAPIKILFGAFENKNRVLFLLRLAGDKTLGDVPGQIVDLNIKPNEARDDLGPIPELKIFEGAIKNMRMDGDKLNEILLLTNDSFYAYFFLTRVVVEYAFTLGVHRGNCTVLYYFQIPKSGERLAAAAFSFSVESVTLEKPKLSAQLPEAKKAINVAVLSAIDKHYRELRAI
jgi:hypothetical protein